MNLHLRELLRHVGHFFSCAGPILWCGLLPRRGAYAYAPVSKRR